MATVFPEEGNEEGFRSNQIITNVTCSLCDNLLTDPKLLPCLHTFCNDCLQEYFDNNQPASCPECKLVIVPGDETISTQDLPNNFLFDILKDKQDILFPTSQNCISCEIKDEKIESSHRCIDCFDSFCDNCKDYHSLSSVTKSHRVVPNHEFLSTETLANLCWGRPNYCQIHFDQNIPQLHQWYCEDCSQVGCYHCIMHDHDPKGHSYRSAEEVSTEQRSALQQIYKKLERHTSGQKQLIDAMQEKGKDMQEEQKAREEDCMRVFVGLHELITKLKDETIRKTRTFYRRELENLIQRIEHEKQIYSRLKSMQAFTCVFLDSCTNAEFLTHASSLHSNMQKAMTTPIVKSICTETLKIKEPDESKVRGALSTILEESSNVVAVEDSKVDDVIEILFDIQAPLEFVYGLACDEEGCLYVLYENEITLYDKDGKIKRCIHCPYMHDSWNVVVKKKKVFLSEMNLKRSIHIMNMSGDKSLLQPEIKLVVDIQDKDIEANEGYEIGVTVDDYENVYASIMVSCKIYRYNIATKKSSVFVSKLQQPDLKAPGALGITSNQELIVSNRIGNNIQVYSENAELLWQYGDGDPRILDAPYGITCDDFNHIYIADSGNKRIVVVKEGTLLGSIDFSDQDEEPWAVATSSTAGGTLVVSQGKRIKHLKIKNTFELDSEDPWHIAL